MTLPHEAHHYGRRRYDSAWKNPPKVVHICPRISQQMDALNIRLMRADRRHFRLGEIQALSQDHPQISALRQLFAEFNVARLVHIFLQVVIVHILILLSFVGFVYF